MGVFAKGTELAEVGCYASGGGSPLKKLRERAAVLSVRFAKVTPKRL